MANFFARLFCGAEDNDRERNMMLAFVVAMITLCAGGAMAEIVVDYSNNNKKNYLFPSAVLLFLGAGIYVITLGLLLFGSRSERFIKTLKIIAYVAVVVPGGAFVLGLMTMKK